MSEAVVNLQEVGSYFDFVHGLHQVMVDKNLMLIYEGEVNQSITKAFSAMAEKNLGDTEESSKTTKRVYHVMVECLQNICKHADDPITGESSPPGQGIFLVSNEKDSYTVTTGNVINSSKVEETVSQIERFNAVAHDREAIKTLYKQMIKESRLSEKAGAGLGFIDIVKKTGNQIDFEIKPVNDITSFLILKSKINRE